VANADILPYDYVEYARTMKQYLPAIDRALATNHWTGSVAPVRDAIDRFESAAAAFNAARDAMLAGQPSHDALERTNAALRKVERAFTRPEGLVTRPWFRNLIYVADEDNGYANMVFPSVNEALRAGDAARTTREIADLAARFDAATAALGEARRVAGGN
jgi:N-acetylated-alpha-linked acidic dipeptidase